jgi:chemotaxis protein methyltransferase CheR
MNMTEKNHIFEAELGPESPLQDFFKDNIVVIRTGFFRNLSLFRDLQNIVLPAILSERSFRSPLRIWSAGCSDGREPYSVAMVCAKFLKEKHPGKKLSVHGSDINSEQIRIAQNGIYPVVTAEQAALAPYANYFEIKESKLQLGREMLQTVNFRHENIIQARHSHPFHILILSNVLLYYEKEYRKKIVAKLAEAVLPGGCFYLESVGGRFMRSLGFERVSSESHFYIKTLNTKESL